MFYACTLILTSATPYGDNIINCLNRTPKLFILITTLSQAAVHKHHKPTATYNISQVILLYVLVASEIQLRTFCFEVPFGPKASPYIVQSIKAATCHRGQCTTACLISCCLLPFQTRSLDSICLSGTYLFKTTFSLSSLPFPLLDQLQILFWKWSQNYRSKRWDTHACPF